ncbi:Anthocyanidin 3-O-glucosyltransferase 1 [Vitis vinifera]|uniref:Anthocyanidin 3-O-glucosyltransferase 1 n=1 Tax=Vitis vinifera TaxID=29760 RepID=A0A438J3N9_VITVI|nr:Anthocyanidin 3-O-glucosyltransferase 1 [Vitis vinifera]
MTAFSVTLLIMKLPFEDSAVTNYIHSVSASVSGSIRFVHLPELDSDSSSSSTNILFSNIIERQKPLVRMQSTSSLANELGAPSYVYFASSAACLALMFHLQTLKDHQGLDVTEFANSDAELWSRFLSTRFQLESCLLWRWTRRVADPWISSTGQGALETPRVFCAGAFHMDQIKEIAIGLENSGHRFLWTLRRPPRKDEMTLSSDYVNFNEVLPEGFLDRTSKIGKIIGWAPQAAV